MSTDHARKPLHAGTGADGSMQAAHNTTVELTCITSDDDPTAPIWFIDEVQALSQDGYRSSRDENTGKLIGTLMINGNLTCGTFNVYCKLESRQIMHSTTLTVEG